MFVTLLVMSKWWWITFFFFEDDTLGLPRLLSELLDDETFGALKFFVEAGVSDLSDRSLIRLSN